jgi:hypothetical protein
VSIPEIQEIVGGNVKVTGSATVTSKVTYAGHVPLVFGFQAVRLFYDGGRYTAFQPIQAGSTAIRDLSQMLSRSEQRLSTDSAFVKLVD